LGALLPALEGSGVNETVSLGPLGSPFVVLVVPYILRGISKSGSYPERAFRYLNVEIMNVA